MATVEHEEVRALHVFRNEEANDYRCAEVIFPEEDGSYAIPMDAEALRGRGDARVYARRNAGLVRRGEEPDFFIVEDFMGILESAVPA